MVATRFDSHYLMLQSIYVQIDDIKTVLDSDNTNIQDNSTQGYEIEWDLSPQLEGHIDDEIYPVDSESESDNESISQSDDKNSEDISFDDTYKFIWYYSRNFKGIGRIFGNFQWSSKWTPIKAAVDNP